jgi:hypothetical protein
VIRAPPGGSYPLSWGGIWRSARSPCGGNLVGVVALIEICLRLPSGPKTVFFLVWVPMTYYLRTLRPIPSLSITDDDPGSARRSSGR